MRWARLFVAVVLLGGCSGGRGDDTLPPPASTTTSTTVDYAVPAVIDVAYVEKVMTALDHVYGDAIRILAKERQITKEFLEYLATLYEDRFFELAQRAWSREALDGFPTLASQPGDPETRVTHVLSGRVECIVAAVERDFTTIRKGPPVDTPQRYIALVPVASQEARNETGWRLAYDGYTQSGSEPSEPCVG